MVSDQEIVNGVQSLLRQINPNAVTSINGFVQQLEAKLGLDLSHKAGFIRDLLIGGGGGGGGGGGVVVQARPQPPPPSTQKDHFALQHYPHFHTTSQHQQHHHLSSSHQQFPPHFALPLHHNHHPEELNFRYPPPQQLYPYPHPHQHQQQQQHQHQQQLQQQHLHQRQQAGRSEAPVVTRVAEAALPEIKKEAGPPEIKKESAPAGTKRRGGPGGLNKVCGVSPQLEAVVGEPALPRTQIVKQLWAYIRKHNLQDPSNKRKIICNDALRLVFETDCTDMFKMNKLLAKHIIPLDPTKEPGPDSKRLKVETESTTESIEAGPEPEVTREAASPTVPTIIISDALARFFDTEEREMTQSEAVRRVWEYVKVHELENELNPMMIMCDPKLQELFGCENISAVEIAEMLMTHFFKQS